MHWPVLHKENQVAIAGHPLKLFSFMRWTLRLFLYPFSVIFCLIARIRNLFYDKGIFKSISYPIPLISVGNITVGGTGKTPMTEYLIRYLLPHYRCALLSRGYGRKTKGPLEATTDSTSLTVGDEPLQLKLKFPELKVIVAEKRVSGMDILLNNSTPPEIVILDDAFQHRAINPGLSILVTDYFRPLYNDFCLPAGNLREPLTGLKRANIVIVNKCPSNLSSDQAKKIQEKMGIKPPVKIFFSSIVYLKPKPLTELGQPLPANQSQWPEKPSIIAISGIGNPKPFLSETNNFGKIIKTITYPDHHDFTNRDLKNLFHALNQSDSNTIILTTEKDAVRLKQKPLNALLQSKIWYIPIKLTILFNQEDLFLKTIDSYVKGN